MILLVHAHDSAVPVELNIAVPTLQLGIAHRTHFWTVWEKLQALIYSYEARHFRLAHKIDEGITDIMRGVEIDR